MMKIGIVNYNMGNLGSIRRKMNLLNYECQIISKHEELKHFDKLILPGVGHFAIGIEQLKSQNLWEDLNEQVLVKKKPIFGICLGLQLMTKSSEEGNVNGLGWFDATVQKFKIPKDSKLKVPHMGWNTVEIVNNSPLIKGINNEDEFYFVHSYHLVSSTKKDILLKTNYGYEFVSAMCRDNIVGYQFHPEKSHDIGKKLLLNFLEL